jgi:23S rRNA (adenine2503-C2)-methyltransferase
MQANEIEVMSERKQIKPTTEGWTQAKDEQGRPLLQFAEPKRKQPPVHLADLSIAG